MKITRENFKKIVREVMIDESEYQEFFKKALEKAGKSIPQMSDDEKKAFFNKIEKTWKGKGEKNERFGRGEDGIDRDGPTFGSADESIEESVNEAPRPPKMKKNKEVDNIVKAMMIVSGLKKGGMASRYEKDFIKAKRRALKAINDMVTYAKIGV